jgi:hypothetical protein
MEPKDGGSTSAEREEAAREFIWRANSALVERLLSIWNDQDDPVLSEIDNKRRRYARLLWAMSAYFHAIGHDKLPGLGTYIASLGVALEDLIRGVTDPLFVTKGSKRKGSKRDSMLRWGARLQAAPADEYFSLNRRDRLRVGSVGSAGPGACLGHNLSPKKGQISRVARQRKGGTTRRHLCGRTVNPTVAACD